MVYLIDMSKCLNLRGARAEILVRKPKLAIDHGTDVEDGRGMRRIFAVFCLQKI